MVAERKRSSKNTDRAAKAEVEDAVEARKVSPQQVVEFLAHKVAEARERPLFVWCESERNIDPSCFHEIREQLKGAEHVPAMDLLIQSPGGDIHSAYRALLVLRSHADHITALVPYWAKSAATFLALGTDEILMGPNGELGPLDVQLNDLTGSLLRRSALNEFRSLEYLRSFALETLDAITTFVSRKYSMDIPHALDHAQALLPAFISPLYEQLRPTDLGQNNRFLTIAEEYGERVMRQWGYRDSKIEEIKAIVRRMVWEYPDHGFAIDLVEAQGLGLNAEPLPEDIDELCWRLVNIGVSMFGPVAFKGIEDEIATLGDGDGDDENTGGLDGKKDARSFGHIPAAR